MPNTAIKTSQIQDDAVTFAKIENASAESILIGRGTGNGGGNYQAVTLGSGLTMSGTTLSASGGVSDGNKGDISVSGSGTTWTIGSSKITDIKIANNTITDNKIAYDTITDSRISSSAGISISKLASQSYSKLIGTSSSSNTVTAITIGSGLTMTGSTLSASGAGGGTVIKTELASNVYINGYGETTLTEITGLTQTFSYSASQHGDYRFKYFLLIGKYDDGANNTVRIRIGDTVNGYTKDGQWRYIDESTMQLTNRATTRDYGAALKSYVYAQTYTPIIIEGYVHIQEPNDLNNVLFYLDCAQTSASGYGLIMRAGSYAEFTKL